MRKSKFILLYAGVFVLSLLYIYSNNFNFEGRVVFNLVILFLIPYSLVLSRGESLRHYGFSLKYRREILLYTLLLLLLAVPGMLYASTLESFNNFYPIFKAAGMAEFIRFEVLLFPSFFLVEFFYRGVVLFSLKKYAGTWCILLQAIPYFLIHIHTPSLELVYSLFAGIFFGYVALKTESIMPTVAAHYITSVLFDFLVW